MNKYVGEIGDQITTVLTVSKIKTWIPEKRSTYRKAVAFTDEKGNTLVSIMATGDFPMFSPGNSYEVVCTISAHRKIETENRTIIKINKSKTILFKESDIKEDEVDMIGERFKRLDI